MSNFTNFSLGAQVRSWDFRNVDEPKFADRPDCYIEGTVIGTEDEHGVSYYIIGVTKIVSDGKEKLVDSYSKTIRVPFNGTPTFRKPTNRVEQI